MVGTEEVRRRLVGGDFALTQHALEQMEARRVTVAAIQSCAARAIEVRPQPENGTLRVLGPFDDTDRNLVIVCGLHGRALVIVTVHPERRKLK